LVLGSAAGPLSAILHLSNEPGNCCALMTPP